MAINEACKQFIPLLSPFIDGELSPKQRVDVERHLGACKGCTGRTADLRAEAGLLRIGMEMLADEADFKDFSQKVMARITPERPSLFEGWRLSLSELFTYHRGAMVSSFATAALAVLIAVPLLMRDRSPLGYANEKMMVQDVESLSTDGPLVAPVVMETEGGGAIIWLIDQPNEAESPTKNDEAKSEELEMDTETKPKKGLGQERPRGGDL
jgi:hypothetical protein